MTHHLDPDRRRPAPPHPGFDNRAIDVDMEVCRWCSALVPADERLRTKHENWDQRIVARFLELFDRVDHLSGVGSRGQTSAVTPADASPAPDHNGASTPPPGHGSRGGAEGHQQATQTGAARPRGATTPSGDVPPSPGGPQRAGRGSGGSGKGHDRTPAGAKHPTNLMTRRRGRGDASDATSSVKHAGAGATEGI